MKRLGTGMTNRPLGKLGHMYYREPHGTCTTGRRVVPATNQVLAWEVHYRAVDQSVEIGKSFIKGPGFCI
jgi:hypothetical protein